MHPALASPKHIAALATGVAATVVAVLAFAWPVWHSKAVQPAVQTVAATSGDLVVTVGGVGRVVEARAADSLAVPAATAQPTAAAATAPSTPTTASPDSVFPNASGRIARYLVAAGQRVRAGQPIAILDDGQAAAAAVAQAQSDAATARLELVQKQTSDPAKGLPPTPAEVMAARLALRSTQEKAHVLAHPLRADTTSARLDLRKARSDLVTLIRPPGRQALVAARTAVDVATTRLAEAEGPAPSVDVAAAKAELAKATADLAALQPTPVDVAASKAEVAKAQADLDALRTPPPGPSAAAIQAAQLAVAVAQQKLAELPAGAPASERTAAELELKKAQADLEALQQPAPGPSPSALAAAQAALDLANQKLAQVTGPPNPLAVAAAQAALDLANTKLAQLLGPPNPVTVASTRLELEKANADLEALLRPATPQAVAAARLAVTLARQRLGQLLRPGTAALDAARAETAKAAADLVTLLRRGAAAGPLDIAIARLKVAATNAHVRAAQLQAQRLIVRAPFAGTVTALLSAQGAPADPTTPVATVADLRHLAVRVDLSEFDVAKVRAGEQAVLSVDALGGRKLPGHVTFVAFGGTDSGGVVTFPVRVVLAQLAGVKPGMNVSVRIIVARRHHVVRVPIEAVHGRSVTVVDAKGKQTQRPVTVGLVDNKLVEIRSGLRAGDRVLLSSPGA